MGDYDLIVSLLEIDDDDDIEVTEWEAGFLNTIVNRYRDMSDAVLKAARLTSKQREAAERMIDKYARR